MECNGSPGENVSAGIRRKMPNARTIANATMSNLRDRARISVIIYAISLSKVSEFKSPKAGLTAAVFLQSAIDPMIKTHQGRIDQGAQNSLSSSVDTATDQGKPPAVTS